MNPHDALENMPNPDRLERLDAVLDQRLSGVTVLLEDVYHPQNMGACIRTLEALGVQNVHIVEGDAPFEPHPKVTQGCHKWVDMHRYATASEAVRALKQSGYRVLATDVEATRTIDDLDFSTPAALCFGNELDGISAELRGAADERFRIPMWGWTRSYNLSVALGMTLYTATRARRRAIGHESDLSPAERESLRRRWLGFARKGSERISEALAQRGG